MLSLLSYLAGPFWPQVEQVHAGHLIGLGSAGLTADSLTMAAALPDGLIPSARRNIEALIATE